MGAFYLAKIQDAYREAESERGRADRLRYLADMSLAHRAESPTDILFTHGLLNEHHSRAGTTDRREFEWYYLWRRKHAAWRTLKGHTGGVRTMAFNPTGANGM